MTHDETNSRLRMLIDGRTVIIRRSSADEIIDLRHRVLRPGLPRDAAMFPGDELPSSGHFGAFADGIAVCCATFHLNSWDSAPALQLRGMATDAGMRGKGLGRAVLHLAESAMTADRRVLQLWCNAREIAVPFYQSMGWAIASEKFEIPTAGPHFRMTKRM
jgi:GNAT superfamily N-acetyltransferase